MLRPQLKDLSVSLPESRNLLIPEEHTESKPKQHMYNQSISPGRLGLESGEKGPVKATGEWKSSGWKFVERSWGWQG